MILATIHWVCTDQQTVNRVTATPVNPRLDSAHPGKCGVFLGVLHKVSHLPSQVAMERFSTGKCHGTRKRLFW